MNLDALRKVYYDLNVRSYLQIWNANGSKIQGLEELQQDLRSADPLADIRMFHMQCHASSFHYASKYVQYSRIDSSTLSIPPVL